MKLLVFGATGGTGKCLVQQALAQGHVVTAFARDPSKLALSHDNLRVVQGDVLNAKAVEGAVAGQDAVLSALGTRIPIRVVIAMVIATQIAIRLVAMPTYTRLFVEVGLPILTIRFLARRTTGLSGGTRNIVGAMERAGVRRLVYESSLGVGDSKGKMGVMHNLIAIPLFLRWVFADKELQEQSIRRSGLDWVIVRPGTLTNGQERKAYRIGSDVGSWFIPSRISRKDVAAFMLGQVTSDEYLRKTPGLAY